MNYEDIVFGMVMLAAAVMLVGVGISFVGTPAEWRIRKLEARLREIELRRIILEAEGRSEECNK